MLGYFYTLVDGRTECKPAGGAAQKPTTGRGDRAAGAEVNDAALATTVEPLRQLIQSHPSLPYSDDAGVSMEGEIENRMRLLE